MAVTEIAFADDHSIYVEAMTYMINSTKEYRVTAQAVDGQDLLDKLRFWKSGERFPDLACWI